MVEKAGLWILRYQNERFRIVHALDQKRGEQEVPVMRPSFDRPESVHIELARRAAAIEEDGVCLDVVGSPSKERFDPALEQIT
jgi:hypothetical protein